MSRILHVVGSPRGAQSTSTRLAEAFLAACGPDVEVDRLDLWAEDLPPFAGEAANGKLKAMSGQPLPPDEQAAFDRVLAHIDRLKAADKVVVSTGMWNFSMPYRLKHWMDLVAQAGLTFGFDPARGYFGLVTGRPVQLLISTGGDFTAPPMQAMDFLTPHLRGYFGFLGFEDIRVVTASCTAYPPEVSGPAIDKALAAAAEAGAAF